MFTTYSASAGSGKTTSLTADYIANCFKAKEQNQYQKILAITFTNNASAEMKDRILVTLETFAFKEEKDYSGSEKAICNMIKESCGAGIDIKTKSRELLRKIVYDYARFTVSTIDSFFQRVLRSSALILGLDINYQLHIDMNEYYQQVTDQLLKEIPDNPELAERIAQLLESEFEGKGKFNIDKKIKEIVDICYNESGYKSMQKKITNISKWRTELNTWMKDWRKKIDDLNKLINKWEIDYAKNKNIWTQEQKQSFGDDHEMNVGNAYDGKVKKGAEIYLEINTYKALLSQLPTLLMLVDVKERLEQLLERDNVFLNAATNLKINGALYEGFDENSRESGQDANMAVYEKEKDFTSFFIDEFQDTSQLQWENLLPLLHNNAISIGKAGNVSLYGDLKQAIYRFRNGDASIFQGLIKKAKDKTNKDYKYKSLDTNYRSKYNVVNFNNQFFDFFIKSLVDTNGYKIKSEYYSDVKQEIHDTDVQNGLVQVYCTDNEQANNIDDDTTLDPYEKCVWKAVQDAKDRGYEYKDMAILVRGNNDCIKYCDMLIEHDIKVISAEYLSLDTSRVVNVIISIMKLLYNPYDKLAQAMVFGYLNSKNKRIPTFEQFCDRKQEDFFKLWNEQVGENEKKISRTIWQSKPLVLLVKDIIECFELPGDADTYVAEFENVVQNYANKSNNDPYKFLEWWQQNIDLNQVPCVSFPKNYDAVTVSTIHKSKGLEYPVVIYAFRQAKITVKPVWIESEAEKLFPKGYTGSKDKVITYASMNSEPKTPDIQNRYETEKVFAELDMLNLQYVVHTRAKDMLYLIGKKPKGNSSTKGSKKKSSEEKPKVKEYSTIIYEFMGALKAKESPNFGEQECGYYFGNKDWKNPKENEEKPEEPEELKLSVSNFQVNTYNLRESYGPEDPRAIGNYVHDFLSKLSVFPQNEKEIASCVKEANPLYREYVEKALNTIMINNADLKPYFEPNVKVLNETSILQPDGTVFRPDRVVFLDDEVMVLDYKTGTKQEENEKKYEAQVKGYCDLIEQMGYKNVNWKLIPIPFK